MPTDTALPLNDRVVLVTGATQGTGLALSHTLARAGAAVAVGCRTLHQAEALAKELRKTYGCHSLPLELDVANRASCENMGEKLLKHYRRIDTIINNAGVMYLDQLYDGDIDHFTETLSTNIGGPFLVTRALVAEMIQCRRGQVINIAGMAGLSGAPFLSAFCASKAALISLTQSWAQELAEYGIKCWAVCPDLVDTPGLRRVIDPGATVCLTPEAVAERILALMIENTEESGAVIPLVAEGEAARV